MGTGYSVQINGQPDPNLGNVASLEVYESILHATTYRLRYTVDIIDGDLPLLKDPGLSPGATISIFAETDDSPVCLVKGPVYAQEIHLTHGGADSTLEVIGADTTITLDRENKAVLWSDQSDSDAVTSILQQHGYTPDIDDTSGVHSDDKRSLVQRESDLAFVRRLARRNGYLFWVVCDSTGATETASFRRPPIDGDPAAELVMNLTDPEPNVSTLDISWDVERPTSALASQLDLNSKSEIDGDVAQSPLNGLGSQRLWQIATDTHSLQLHGAVDDAADLRSRAEGALIEAEFFVRARGQTTVKTLGSVLRAHTVINLRGVGVRHSGKWFCASVRHTIDDIEHRMEFELVRNGWNA